MHRRLAQVGLLPDAGIAEPAAVLQRGQQRRQARRDGAASPSSLHRCRGGQHPIDRPRGRNIPAGQPVSAVPPSQIGPGIWRPYRGVDRLPARWPGPLGERRSGPPATVTGCETGASGHRPSGARHRRGSRWLTLQCAASLICDPLGESVAVGGRSRRRQPDELGLLRFAFYGRVSTADFQERDSSRRWQLDVARGPRRRPRPDRSGSSTQTGVGGCRGGIGRRRRCCWRRSPIPGRDFDAIAVGEYERAFYGDQVLWLLPLFEAYGVQLWLPEAQGRVDLAKPAHQALLMLLGAQSKREVGAAGPGMRAQIRDEGRFLGGRPLYGYRLVDAGPHPNPMHSKWGRRLRRYDEDAVTAPTVSWIFAEPSRGRRVSSIIAKLNTKGVPCPSQVDRARNPHRAVHLGLDDRAGDSVEREVHRSAGVESAACALFAGVVTASEPGSMDYMRKAYACSYSNYDGVQVNCSSGFLLRGRRIARWLDRCGVDSSGA